MVLPERQVLDMQDVVDSIKNYDEYEAVPQYDKRVEAGDDIGETMTNLIHKIHKDDINPETCVFYMSPKNLDDLRHNVMVSAPSPGYSFRGRPVKIHPTMPDDTILFMAPDSVGLGGKVYNPLAISYAEID